MNYITNWLLSTLLWLLNGVALMLYSEWFLHPLFTWFPRLSLIEAMSLIISVGLLYHVFVGGHVLKLAMDKDVNIKGLLSLNCARLILTGAAVASGYLVHSIAPLAGQ